MKTRSVLIAALTGLGCAAADGGEPAKGVFVAAYGGADILVFDARSGVLLHEWGGSSPFPHGLAVDGSGFIYRVGGGSPQAQAYDGATGELLFGWEADWWLSYEWFLFGPAATDSGGAARVSFTNEPDHLIGLDPAACHARITSPLMTFADWKCIEPLLALSSQTPTAFDHNGSHAAILAFDYSCPAQECIYRNGVVAGVFHPTFRPLSMRLLNNGADLYFADAYSSRVLRYKMFSFENPEVVLEAPSAPAGHIEIDADGILWLSHPWTGRVLHYRAETGEFIREFASHPLIRGEIAFGDLRTPIWAETFEVTRGTHEAGGIDELHAKDETYFVVQPDAALGASVLLTTSVPAEDLGRLARIGLNFEVAQDCALASLPKVTGHVLNVRTGAYDLVATATSISTPCESDHYASLHPGYAIAGWKYRLEPLADYVDEAGMVVVRLDADGTVPYTFSIDRFKVDYTLEVESLASVDCLARTYQGGAPESVSIDQGQHMSGDVSSVIHSDDDRLVVTATSSGPKEFKAIVEVEAVMPFPKVACLTVDVEASAGENAANLWVQVLDHETGAYESAITIPLGGDDAAKEVILSDAHRYVSGKRVRLLVTSTSAEPATCLSTVFYDGSLDALSTLFGELISGGSRSLAESDDERLEVEAHQAGEQYNALIEVTATSPLLDAGCIRVGIEGSAEGAGADLLVQILNHDTGLFEQVLVLPVGAADASAEIALAAGGRYVRATDGLVRMYVASASTGAHVMRLDQVSIAASGPQTHSLRLDRLGVRAAPSQTIGGPCPADCTDDGEVNILDFLCFHGLASTGDPAADCNEDGFIDVFDFLCFQGLAAQGC
jgi:hypothetical protein